MLLTGINYFFLWTINYQYTEIDQLVCNSITICFTYPFYKWPNVDSYIRQVGSLGVWVETFISGEDTMGEEFSVRIKEHGYHVSIVTSPKRADVELIIFAHLT